MERNIQRIAPGLARIVDTDVVAHHVLDVLSRVETLSGALDGTRCVYLKRHTQVQHELDAEHVHRGVLTPAGAAEVEKDLNADRSELLAARRRKRGANVDRHVDLVRGRGGGDADTTESQRDMLDLTMTNAWSATTAASTHTRHRGTEELSEI